MQPARCLPDPHYFVLGYKMLFVAGRAFLSIVQPTKVPFMPRMPPQLPGEIEKRGLQMGGLAKG